MIPFSIHNISNIDLLQYLFIFCFSIFIITQLKLNIITLFGSSIILLIYIYYNSTKPKIIKYQDLYDIISDLKIYKQYNPYVHNELIRELHNFIKLINKNNTEILNDKIKIIMNLYSSLIVSIPIELTNTYTKKKTKLYKLLISYHTQELNPAPLPNDKLFNNKYELFI
tara:strand:- start:25 stop:531 length:507 start_codon:yes stop_codon:yes gene_type:complete